MPPCLRDARRFALAGLSPSPYRPWFLAPRPDLWRRFPVIQRSHDADAPNIVGPPCSTTRSRAASAVCHSGRS